MKYESKLIVIRGNSASGKSTIAKKVRELSSGKLAIIEQDYVRRIVLKEKDAEGGDNIELIFEMAIFALKHDYDVLLEGILNFSRYGEMLKKLEASCPNNYFFYMDVSFEETMNRHSTKSTANEFGEERMTRWYTPQDLTRFLSEIVIPENSTLEESAQLIIKRASLPVREAFL